MVGDQSDPGAPARGARLGCIESCRGLRCLSRMFWGWGGGAVLSRYTDQQLCNPIPRSRNIPSFFQAGVGVWAGRTLRNLTGELRPPRCGAQEFGHQVRRVTWGGGDILGAPQPRPTPPQGRCRPFAAPLCLSSRKLGLPFIVPNGPGQPRQARSHGDGATLKAIGSQPLCVKGRLRGAVPTALPTLLLHVPH